MNILLLYHNIGTHHDGQHPLYSYQPNTMHACFNSRADINSIYEFETGTHRRASMVRLGAEQHLVDEIDWDQVLAEQRAKDLEDENENREKYTSRGDVVAPDTPTSE